jgi:2-polyprenyl-3-methyl-5-hydroxy-6-metoxy-1,4-benzoquinol methylase
MTDLSRWELRYRDGDLPWDTGRPDSELMDLVRKGGVTAGRAIDIGCGTGTNALWLAQRGFDVLGVDISETAVEMARQKALERGIECRFEVVDVLNDTMSGQTFDFVFDMGCFHTFEAAEEQDRFAARMAELLPPGQLWLSIVGSTDGPGRDHGPPRRSARELIAAVEPYFEVESLISFWFDAELPSPARAWRLQLRRRGAEPQPSSRRAARK